MEVLGAGSLQARRLPRAWLLGFPPSPGKPGEPLWAPFVCARPGSGDALDLVFKQRACSLWAGPGVCSPSLNLQIGLHFGHFDGPVIVSQFSNFQFPPPGWGWRRDFKDAFDNVSRLQISITIFFTRSLCLMQPQMSRGGEGSQSPPPWQPGRRWRQAWGGTLQGGGTQDPLPASSSSWATRSDSSAGPGTPSSAPSSGTSGALPVSPPPTRPCSESLPCSLLRDSLWSR